MARKLKDPHELKEHGYRNVMLCYLIVCKCGWHQFADTTRETSEAFRQHRISVGAPVTERTTQ